jgi:hypothetical protein
LVVVTLTHIYGKNSQEVPIRLVLGTQADQRGMNSMPNATCTETTNACAQASLPLRAGMQVERGCGTLTLRKQGHSTLKTNMPALSLDSGPEATISRSSSEGRAILGKTLGGTGALGLGADAARLLMHVQKPAALRDTILVTLDW